MNKSITEIMREYGINAQEVMKQREYPEFDFSIFKGMDQKYDKILNDYRRIKNSEDYSPDFKEKKRKEALAAIDALKAEYYTDAMVWIDKTYRRKKPKQKRMAITTNDAVIAELERNRQITVLAKQLEIEPAEKLLDLYRQYKEDNEDAATMIELELRSRKDQHGTNESVHAMKAWTQIQLDQHAGDLVAEHYEAQLRSVLCVGSSWYSRGLENGFNKAQYGPIEL
jgi:hypothetical protein